MRARFSAATIGAIVLITLASVVTPVAAANGRVDGGKIDYTWGPVSATNLCPFEVSVVFHFDGTWRLIAHGDGYLEEDAWAEQDTFTGPTGRTLTSDWYHYRIGGTHDADFNITSESSSGQVMRVTLPDGSVFMSAGHVRFDVASDVVMVITPDVGHSGDVAAFCAALSQDAS